MRKSLVFVVVTMFVLTGCSTSISQDQIRQSAEYETVASYLDAIIGLPEIQEDVCDTPFLFAERVKNVLRSDGVSNELVNSSAMEEAISLYFDENC